jgi:hypothetical protein
MHEAIIAKKTPEEVFFIIILAGASGYVSGRSKL